MSTENENGAAASQSELSLVALIEKLPAGGKGFSLQATRDQCVAISKRLGVVGVHSFEGTVTLKATAKSIIASGRLSAILVRECVASLEEMDETVTDSFEIEFLRQEPEHNYSEEEAALLLPEVHEAPEFDVGEFLIQQLALAMDQFPRKAGATSLVEQYGTQPEFSPFDVLQAISEKADKNQ